MTRAKEFEKAVADLLAARRVPYIRVSNYRCFRCGQVQNASAKGMPDCLLLDPFMGLEMKTGTGRLTPDQQRVREYFQKSGTQYLLLRDTVDELVRVLDRGETRGM